MLTIRPEQVSAFTEALLRDFENRMIRHLLRLFPSQIRSFGDLGARDTIKYGIRKAARYGIVSERDICKYVELMMEWGRDCDEDPELPWITGILNDKYPQGPAGKIECLFERAEQERARRR